MKLAAILLALAPSVAFAGPDRISFMIGADHICQTACTFAGRKPLMAVPGVFMTWERKGFDVSAGAYENSYGNGSVALMFGLPLYRRHDVSFDLLGGVATYPRHADDFAMHMGAVVPMIGAEVRYRNVYMQVYPGSGNLKAIIAAGVTVALNK